MTVWMPTLKGLTPMTQPANEINRCILSMEEEMADDASPRLKSIRRSKLSTNEKIHSQLTSMVNGAYRTFYRMQSLPCVITATVSP